MLSCKTVLVILHEFSPSGAPILLLNQLSNLDTKINFVFISNVDGELKTEYENIGKVYVLKFNALNRSWNSRRLIVRLLSLIYLHCFSYFILIKYRPSKILSNTITNSRLVYFFCKFKRPIYTYVHEGPQLLNEAKRNDDVYRSFEYSNIILAVSEIVKIKLLELNCDKPIRLVHGGVKIPKKTNDNRGANLKYQILIVGRMHFFKGSDLLVPYIMELLKFNEDFIITWLGVDKESMEYNLIQFDIDRLGLNKHVNFIELTNTNIDSFYKGADIIVSLSRSESFSLVAIEAASNSKICLYFENIGGPDEIFKGIDLPKVPYLNLGVMAQETILLFNDLGLRQRLESEVYTRFLNHYTIESSSRMLEKILIE